MMQVLRYPERGEWKTIIERPRFAADVAGVEEIVRQVKLRGDEAVREYQLRFGGSTLTDFLVTDAEFSEANEQVPDELKQAIKTAANNISTFHKEKQSSAGRVIETMPGVECWSRIVPISNVGLYVPGGSAPLFSTLLMLGIPAKIAGCGNIAVCSPADRSGKLHPAILYAASLIGIRQVYKIGGAQAIAAMAYGTGSIPKVDKIFGPGNAYVTGAKQLVQAEGVAIDLPAGPSELCVLADETAKAPFVAADLLSQAEHGPDSQVLLVTTCESLLDEVVVELGNQLELLPRKDIAARSMANSRAVLLSNKDDAMQLVNDYAPEHLVISCSDAEQLAEQVVNAGSVFLGNYAPESAGDYASGTNHTLPTNGYARAYSGVNLASFQKSISFQRLSRAGLEQISSTVISMAVAEGLQAHANAVSIRINS